MIKIFLTNLGMYNEGILMGEWVTLPVDSEELQDVFKRIKIDGVRYEEYFITDWETELDSLEISEYDNIDYLNKLAESLEDLGYYDLKKIEAIHEWKYFGDNIMEAIDNIEDFTLYTNVTNEKELGEEYFENISDNIPEEYHQYFDFERYGKDMHLSGEGFFSRLGYICK